MGGNNAKYVPVEKLAEELACSQKTIRRMCKQQEIPAFKVRNRWRIDRERALNALQNGDSKDS